MAAHQATLSLGFFRQEHWNGLPFPSPMCESEVAQSCRLLATPWTAAHQAPLSVGFSRKEYWSGVPLLQVTCTLICFLGVPEAALQAEVLGRALLQRAPHASPADLQTLGKGHVLLQAACVLHEFLVGTP